MHRGRAKLCDANTRRRIRQAWAGVDHQSHLNIDSFTRKRATKALEDAPFLSSVRARVGKERESNMALAKEESLCSSREGED